MTNVEGYITVDIPEGVPTGDYTVWVTFRDSRFPWIESDRLPATIHVNLPSTYTKPLFYNVIILIDTCECFTDVQWYHRKAGGEWEAIPGANGYNYREVDGLTGEYFVRVTMQQGDSSLVTYTCPQGDLMHLVEDEGEEKASVTVYPNPATESTTIMVEHSPQRTHVLRVLNMVGVEMERRTFEGSETRIDLGMWEKGTYVVSVDGMIVRIVKN